MVDMRKVLRGVNPGGAPGAGSSGVAEAAVLLRGSGRCARHPTSASWAEESGDSGVDALRVQKRRGDPAGMTVRYTFGNT
ncbi:hypothetical protein GCM10017591_11370 [Microbacterium dextranolyticum]|uniref:Uncharacterized protein n=1 Tax=Microbacterium dextranolyticum TaxID=36806 RepID=A0A9W6HKR4_9MICO|nr:hypothetical protein GCM10017591_11370 [Microbacterium dextranolyticum]